jgi:hypothetical protein
MLSRFPGTSAATTCAALVVLAAMAWTANGAPACACGELRGPVVARGQSLYGVPWQIKATRAPRRGPQPPMIEVEFSIGQEDDYTGGGYSTHLFLPLHPEFFLTANYGSEVTDYSESDISGVTRRRVWTLTIEMSNGESVRVQPTLAPSQLLRRFRWLRQVRFYDVFFSASQTPERITALDRQGNVLVRYRSHRGIFR